MSPDRSLRRPPRHPFTLAFRTGTSEPNTYQWEKVAGYDAAGKQPITALEKQSDLCENCSRGLVIDDYETSRNILAAAEDLNLKLKWASSKVGELRAGQWKDRILYEGSATPPNLPELCNPAANDCLICQALKEALSELYENCSWWNETTQSFRFRVQYQWNASHFEAYNDTTHRTKPKYPHLGLDSLAISVSHPALGSEFIDAFQLAISAEEGPCKDWLRIERWPFFDRDLACHRNICEIRGWLEDCTKHHEECRSTGSAFAPTRLIDVGPDSNTDKEEAALNPMLIQFDEITRRYREGDPIAYACLSYCWGPASETLKTTPQTLRKHMQSIQWKEMPLVYQDAILLARKLGIRYLWIDALCIIQNDEDNRDWEQESIEMTKIFSNAYVTFGAAATSSCRDPFLLRQPSRSVEIPFQSSIDPKVSGAYRILLSKDYDRFPFHTELGTSTWNTRGWVWQEQMAANRIIMFGEKMIHLKCGRVCVSEDGTDSKIRNFVTGLWYNRPHHAAGPWNKNQWFEWIEEYSQRKLTKPGDRLGAVAGMAQKISKLREKEGSPVPYLAGLWHDEDLYRTLLWAIRGTKVSFENMTTHLLDKNSYVAPSWSWASRSQGVLFAIYMASPWDGSGIELLDYDIRAASSDAMIMVGSGSSMTLAGKVASNMHKLSEATMVNKSLSSTWEFPWVPAPPGSIWKLPLSESYDIIYNLDWDPTIGESESGYPQQTLTLLMTAKPNEKGETAGLILLPIRIESENVYYRVGTFELKSDYTQDAKENVDSFFSWTHQIVKII